MIGDILKTRRARIITLTGIAGLAIGSGFVEARQTHPTSQQPAKIVKINGVSFAEIPVTPEKTADLKLTAQTSITGKKLHKDYIFPDQLDKKTATYMSPTTVTLGRCAVSAEVVDGKLRAAPDTITGPLQQDLFGHQLPWKTSFVNSDHQRVICNTVLVAKPHFPNTLYSSIDHSLLSDHPKAAPVNLSFSLPADGQVTTK